MSNNQFSSVKVDRNYDSIDTRFLLPEFQDQYTTLVQAGRFVIKRDPHMTIAYARQFARRLPTSSVSGSLSTKFSGFVVRKNFAPSDMTSVNGVTLVGLSS